jgi:hypothetical protein
MEGPIPDSVARLIAAQIRSLEQLETLLLLAGNPQKEWSAEEVYSVIRSSRGSVAERLEELRWQGLLSVAADARYRYAPQVPETAAAIELLALLYKERRVKIVEMIYSQPSDPLRGFADAFKFKKDK